MALSKFKFDASSRLPHLKSIGLAQAVNLGWTLTHLDGKIAFELDWPRLKISLDKHKEWIRGGRMNNLGLITGSPSGVWVIDLDHEAADRMNEFPPTVTVTSGSGAKQLIYRALSGDPLKNWNSIVAEHIDLKVEGGQVALVGSVHPTTGRAYDWMPGRSPDEIAFAPFPLEQVQKMIMEYAPVREVKKIKDRLAYAQAALDAEAAKVKASTTGTRRDTLRDAALSLGRFVANGTLAREMVESTLLASAPYAHDFTANEVNKTVRDALNDAMKKAPSVSVAAAAAPVEWQEPRELGHPTLPPVVLHAPLVPGWVADMVEHSSKAVDIAPDAASLMALGILSGTICQTRFKVKTWGEHCEHLPLYMMGALPPGERKSALVNLMTAPAWALRGEAVEQFSPEMDAWRKVRKQAEKEGGVAGLPPARGGGQFMYKDFSAAAMERDFYENGERGLVATAEAGILLDNAGGKLTNDKGRLDGGLLLEGYDREPTDSRRITRQNIHLKAPFLAIAAFAQTSVIYDAFANSAFRGRGLTGRIAWIMPSLRNGQRDKDAPAHAVPQDVLDQWSRNILTEGMKALNHTGEAVTISLSAKASALWNDFYHATDARMAPGGDMEEFADWAGKHAGRIARIAAVCHVAEHGSKSAKYEVSRERMDAAIKLGEAMTRHFQFLVHGRPAAHSAATRILARVKAGDIVDGTTSFEITRHHWSGLGNTTIVETGLALLEERRWARGAALQGMGRPTTRYEFHPSLRLASSAD